MRLADARHAVEIVLVKLGVGDPHPVIDLFFTGVLAHVLVQEHLVDFRIAGNLKIEIVHDRGQGDPDGLFQAAQSAAIIVIETKKPEAL
jgi:hypothetical protein